jgi:hypothetical protein
VPPEPGEDEHRPVKGFGCCHCCAAAKPSSWSDHVGALERVSVLVDKSHFDVSVRRCGQCGQRFVFVFTEFVDPSGQDPQYWTLIPVDDAELDTIIAMGSHPDLELIGALGTDRRCLYYNHPTDSDADWGWVEGRPIWLQEGH